MLTFLLYILPALISSEYNIMSADIICCVVEFIAEIIVVVLALINTRIQELSEANFVVLLGRTSQEIIRAFGPCHDIEYIDDDTFVYTYKEYHLSITFKSNLVFKVECY